MDKRIYNFMFIAYIMSLRSKCLRRKVGCIILSDTYRIIGSGYNGPPSKYPHCKVCVRESMESGEALDICPAIHAEANALLQCSQLERARILLTTSSPCVSCMKMILNTPIKEIYCLEEYPGTREMFKDRLKIIYLPELRAIIENLKGVEQWQNLLELIAIQNAKDVNSTRKPR